MNRKVKRYDPINSDGTCGMCIEDADYGAYVEFADYAALAAELSALKAQQAGQELDELRRACAEILGQDPEAWPSHGNAPLAIASALAILSAPSAPKADDSDAANYRWLREQHNNVNSDIGVYNGANILATQEGELDLDAAIAAARKGEGE